MAALRDDQWRRWRRGERVLAEAYLAQAPDVAADPEAAIDLIYSEFLLREERGEAPEPEEYVRRFPHLAEALRRHLALHLAIGSDLRPAESFGSSSVTPDASRTSVPPEIPAGLLAPAERSDELGRLGGYRVLAVLGAGGMGVVFRAEDPALGRAVALKVIRPDLVGAATRQRFLREARAAAAVEHEHVVAVYHVGEDRGIPFLVMPLLTGESLESRLRRAGPPPVADVLRIGCELAEGLAAAHARGLVHRDLKPSNVWLEAKDEGGGMKDEQRGAPPSSFILPPSSFRRVKILDFGLARGADEAGVLTQLGETVGTPAYMSPEQARGEAVDCRSDLFSLGSILYRTATGDLPFPGTSAPSVLWAVCEREPPPARQRRAELPEPLEALIRRLLAKRPADRPAAAEVAAELRSMLGQASGLPPVPPPAVRTTTARRLSRRALLGALTAVALLIAVLLPVSLWNGFWGAREDPIAADPGKPPPGGTPPLKGWLDVVVARGPAEARTYLRLGDPAALPLKAGSDHFRVEARMNRPAFLYLVWVDTEGKAGLLYPWDEEHDRRPPDEQPAAELFWPTPLTASLLPADPPGTISLLLLAREDRLPPDVDVGRLFGDLPRQKSLSKQEAAWFEDGRLVQGEKGQQAIGFGPDRTKPRAQEGAVAIDDPVLQVQALLRTKLRDLFPYSRAACFSCAPDR
jgi:serine/threonine protein kinase